ncbi:MAG: spore coat protein CotJB [Firmicutes bacterium]|nr:spore coat protein CotJB [Bacillota bacterium]
MNEKIMLLRKIQQLHFMMIEAGLFLDNQNRCCEALADFEKYKKLYLEAKAEYEKCYGPLSYEGVNGKCEDWSWVQGPWPWEGEC